MERIIQKYSKLVSMYFNVKKGKIKRLNKQSGQGVSKIGRSCNAFYYLPKNYKTVLKILVIN